MTTLPMQALSTPLVALQSPVTPLVSEIFDAHGNRVCHVNAGMAGEIVTLVNSSAHAAAMWDEAMQRHAQIDTIVAALKKLSCFVYRLNRDEKWITEDMLIEMAADGEEAVRLVEPGWACYMEARNG
jgi:hypothetical protein